ncbi:MAG: hypothetical protein LBI39_01885 [Puniceicoccales bacterium]|nr:hypothetical protein [Puniceicoccales bacterium]
MRLKGEHLDAALSLGLAFALRTLPSGALSCASYTAKKICQWRQATLTLSALLAAAAIVFFDLC